MVLTILTFENTIYMTVINIENGCLMGKTKADLILHPARLRIMGELGGRQMTPRQLSFALPDLAQASLYRHIKALLDGGILEVVNEQEVNGAMERTYAIVKGGGRLSIEELNDLSPEEHLRYFTIYAVKLIDDFAGYLHEADLEQIGSDGMSYSTAVIYLNNEERAQFQQDVIRLIGHVMSFEPSPDRKRFSLSSIVIPDRKD